MKRSTRFRGEGLTTVMCRICLRAFLRRYFSCEKAVLPANVFDPAAMASTSASPDVPSLLRRSIVL
eukprot:scaffold109027_cov39-Tisochrysis_lutea.AAC.1